MASVPTPRETTLRQAVEFHRNGRWGDADAMYRRILETEPDHPDVLHLLGVVSNQLGRPDDACALIRRAIVLLPERIEFHNSLGNALRAQGDRAAAAAAFQHALTLQPDSVEVWTNLGALLEEADNLEDATLCYLRALELNRNYGDAHFALGNLLKRAGNEGEAIEHYQRTIDLESEYAPEAHNNLGTLLRSRGLDAPAVEQFRRAIQLRRSHFEAHINLGDTLEQMACLEEAARTYQQALVLKPGSAIAYSGVAGVLQDQGRADRATAAYREALRLAPDNAALHSNYLLNLQYDPSVTAAEMLAAHQEWDARHARTFREDARHQGRRPDTNRPLRIGFVSADFRRHPVGFFLLPLLAEKHPDMIGICYSDVTNEDEMTARLRSAAQYWRQTPGYSDVELADAVRADEVDILFDLAGHTRGNRLLAFARRPAPVQVTWAGYTGTTGMQAMDYLLADHWQAPAGAEAWFVERVVRLPDGYICYAPPAAAPPVTALPARSNGHITFGCFNKLAKINVEVVRLWSRLLVEIPDARLILKNSSLADEAVRKRYRKMFASEGVAAGRVDLRGPAGHAELLAAYGEVDIALDPFPYSGGLTTCEAMWMGVPVITLTADRFAGRHATSHLHNVGLEELVAAAPEQYLAIASGLARDIDTLESMRTRLRQQMAASPLCNGSRFAGNFQAAMRNLHKI